MEKKKEGPIVSLKPEDLAQLFPKHKDRFPGGIVIEEPKPEPGVIVLADCPHCNGGKIIQIEEEVTVPMNPGTFGPPDTKTEIRKSPMHCKYCGTLFYKLPQKGVRPKREPSLLDVVK